MGNQDHEVVGRTLVLLSGGLDSTAALLWALHRSKQVSDVEAVFFSYGQPAGFREVRSAIDATTALGVQFNRCDLQSAFYGGVATGLLIPRPSSIVDGKDTAFLPGRNAVMLTVAAARAGGKWPGESVQLVVGYNAQDSTGFPDCRKDFITLLETAINAGGGEVSIAAPWIAMSKREIVAWVEANEPTHRDLLEQSWSCYAATGPCGKCTACVTRAGAFA
jgi:7-cyano-7-deazaguanine synthase